MEIHIKCLNKCAPPLPPQKKLNHVWIFSQTPIVIELLLLLCKIFFSIKAMIYLYLLFFSFLRQQYRLITFRKSLLFNILSKDLTDYSTQFMSNFLSNSLIQWQIKNTLWKLSTCNTQQVFHKFHISMSSSKRFEKLNLHVIFFSFTH